jgi:DNA-binding transcriptional ArsR family regulator
MKEIVGRLKSLGDETRLRIYRLLSEKGELCVCDITQTLGITQTHASRSLGVLKNAGLVKDRRDGLWMHYSILKEGINEAVISFIKEMSGGDETFKNDIKKSRIVLKKNSGCCKKYCKQEKSALKEN